MNDDLKEKYLANEKELAKYKLKAEKQQDEIIQLKRQMKSLEKQVYDLSMLLGEKIDFKNKFKRIMLNRR